MSLGSLRAVNFIFQNAHEIPVVCEASERIARGLAAKIVFELPDDPQVPAAVNRALPVVVADESSPFSRAIAELLPSVFPASAPGEQANETAEQANGTALHRRFRLRGPR